MTLQSMEDYQAKYYNEALLHYGVKGMKWGVRRASRSVKSGLRASRTKRRTRRVAKLDKKINSLKAQQNKREKRLAEQIAKRGYAPMNKYTDPRVTANAIKKKQIQRDSVKRGDSGRVTRLKLQQDHVQSQIDSFNKRLASPEGVTLRELKAYQNHWSTLDRINKDLKKAQKKKKKS